MVCHSVVTGVCGGVSQCSDGVCGGVSQCSDRSVCWCVTV